MYLLTSTTGVPRVSSRRRGRRRARRSRAGLPPLSGLLADKLLTHMLITQPDAMDIAVGRLIDRLARDLQCDSSVPALRR